jgi:uncharacterized protein YjdB
VNNIRLEGGNAAFGTNTLLTAVWGEIQVDSVALSCYHLIVGIGETADMEAFVAPANATNRNIVWSGSDESVAAVDENGKITAIADGTATVTATTQDGNKTANCEVVVMFVAVPVSHVTLSEGEASMFAGESKQLICTVFPAGATARDVVWSSSDSAVAAVDQSGKVAGKKEGSATVTLKSLVGGKTSACEVRVKPIPAAGVKLSETEIFMLPGGTNQLTATVSPAAATDKRYAWDSSDSTVVSVDSDGNVTAHQIGEATITVRTADGGKTASCIVTVEPVRVTKVTLSMRDLTLGIGKSGELAATVFPGNATEQGITWASSDSSIVFVDQSGNVMGKKEGSATVTVTTKDGGLTARCTVGAMTIRVGSIEPSSAMIGVGKSVQLNAIVLPDNATNPEISWASSDQSIATVDANGMVVGKKEGFVEITAGAKDSSGKRAKSAVFVYGPELEEAVEGEEGDWTEGDGGNTFWEKADSALKWILKKLNIKNGFLTWVSSLAKTVGGWFSKLADWLPLPEDWKWVAKTIGTIIGCIPGILLIIGIPFYAIIFVLAAITSAIVGTDPPEVPDWLSVRFTEDSVALAEDGDTPYAPGFVAQGAEPQAVADGSYKKINIYCNDYNQNGTKKEEKMTRMIYLRTPSGGTPTNIKWSQPKGTKEVFTLTTSANNMQCKVEATGKGTNRGTVTVEADVDGKPYKAKVYVVVSKKSPDFFKVEPKGSTADAYQRPLGKGLKDEVPDRTYTLSATTDVQVHGTYTTSKANGGVAYYFVQVKNREGAQKWVFVRAEVVVRATLELEVYEMAGVVYGEGGNSCVDSELYAISHTIMNRYKDKTGPYAGINSIHEVLAQGYEAFEHPNGHYKKALNYYAKTNPYPGLGTGNNEEHSNMDKCLLIAINTYQGLHADNVGGATDFNQDPDFKGYPPYYYLFSPAPNRPSNWIHYFWIPYKNPNGTGL